ncbi:transposase [Gallibacterium anatis]|uniref:transposase n=1 Tax=Gallibacterium anatis TaxID=750 RepID=UPI00223148B0|nr:transposase [Gallibacterium anatis]UZD16532.1 transposase [Gallibacterium anatis]
MTKYNQTFKQQVVDFYFQHEESLSLTCRTFTVSKRTLRRWIAQYQHSGIKGSCCIPNEPTPQSLNITSYKRFKTEI